MHAWFAARPPFRRQRGLQAAEVALLAPAAQPQGRRPGGHGPLRCGVWRQVRLPLQRRGEEAVAHGRTAAA
eukprot:14581958-Alexandrium_andersonii.AAC.1